VRFDRISADASFYQKLSKRAVLATNLWGSVAWGNVPFNMMAELGGPKKMRGYYQGRFRDNNVLLAQTELRFDIFKRFGGVIFGSTGMMGNESRLLRTDDWKYSYGAGLRFTANRRDHLNIRIDYALGQNSRNFYLTIGEAF
jgi:outer membrane protein assembly factor BamA